MLILITGAAGKTGLHIIRALSRQGVTVRAFIHHSTSEQAVRNAGAVEVVAGDFAYGPDVRAALRGVRKIYHICPNMHLDEVSIGRNWIDAASEAGVEHFAYHSVIHPQIEAMPHHWHKLRVEEYLFTSGIAWTILQPTAYMQNILAGWQSIVEQGMYVTPYPVSSALALVDIADVGEAAVRVLTEPGHAGAIYELAGTPPMTQTMVAGCLQEVLERPVRAQAIALEDWTKQARRGGMQSHAVETLGKMFAYYAEHGLVGNPHVLTWLLGRQPTSLVEFIRRAAGTAQEVQG